MQSHEIGPVPHAFATHSRLTGTPLCSTQSSPGWHAAPVEHANEAQAAVATLHLPFRQLATTRPVVAQSW
jgi:hypothetical protein